MNLDLIFALIFYGVLILFFLKNRHKFELQGKIFALYRTKLGLTSMDKISKSVPRFLKKLGIVSIIVGFSGMLLIFYLLIKGTYSLLFIPETKPMLAPLFPGVQIPGAPPLSFLHWIIGIFFVAVIHEFSHGIYARLHKVKIKSSGFAFLGPILAAFVEPDEKQLARKNKKQQLEIFSAGPFSNIISGVIILLILLLLITPYALSFYNVEGVQVYDLEEDYPIKLAGIEKGELILKINNVEISNIQEFTDFMKNVHPNEKLSILTNKTSYVVITTEHPSNSTKGYLGIVVADQMTLKDPTAKLPYVVIWLRQLLVWIYVISFGIALFNLLPLGPVDGGRMFMSALLIFTKNKEKAKKIWASVSIFCLLLIFINLLPYIIKLLSFLFNLF